MTKALIDGVGLSALKLLPNEFGRLMEVQSRDDANFPGFGQVYVTQSLNGVVKAWYSHRKQIDQLAVITGLLKLVLYDGRSESPSFGAVDEIIMGDLKPLLVQIPPGVWHGFQAIGETSAFLLHLNSEPYDFAAPDEERRPKDDSSIPYQW